jgi:sulfopyruvate decarboxylase TPP-binding subunit
MSGLGIRLHERMRKAGVSHLVSVANGEGFGLYQAFKLDAECTVVDACREGEAVAICCGLFLGGRIPVLSIENFGLFECLDTLRALPIALRIPMILIIGYTGRPALSDEGERAVLARYGNIAPQAILGAKWTEPALAMAGIASWYVSPTDNAATFDEAYRKAIQENVPVAILVDMT